jgi:hypothetical protein
VRAVVHTDALDQASRSEVGHGERKISRSSERDHGLGARRAGLADAGEPGSRDMARIAIWDAGGSVVPEVSGNIQRGNNQAFHERIE